MKITSIAVTPMQEDDAPYKMYRVLMTAQEEGKIEPEIAEVFIMRGGIGTDDLQHLLAHKVIEGVVDIHNQKMLGNINPEGG
jgi:hypothetical protein